MVADSYLHHDLGVLQALRQSPHSIRTLCSEQYTSKSVRNIVSRRLGRLLRSGHIGMTKNIGIRNSEPLYFSMDKKYHIIIFSERFGGSVYYTWCVEVVREHVVFDEGFLLTPTGWKIEPQAHIYEESRVLKWL